MSGEKKDLLQFRNRLRGTRTPRNLLFGVRDMVSPALYSEVIAWIRSNALYCAGLFSPEYPAEARQISATPKLHTTSLPNELRWAGAYLSAHGTRIANFLTVSLDFQRALLRDDYRACREALEAVERQFGQSLWLIKNKIAFLQISEGLEAQKRYLNDIREEARQTPPLVAYIAANVSIRNEFASNPLRITDQMIERLSTVNLPRDLDAYCRYQINPNNGLDLREMADVLRYDNTVSVIDHYETLLTVSQLIISSDDPTLRSVVGSALRPLQERVADPRVNILLFKIEGRNLAPQPVEAAVFHVSNAFLQGRYAEAAEAASNSLPNFPESADLREMAARAAVLLPERSEPNDQPLGQRLLSRMSSIIAKKGTTGEDIDELFRVSLNFHYFPWARALLGFVCREVSSDPLEQESGVVTFAACAQPSLSPFRVAALPDLTMRRSYAAEIGNRLGAGSVSAYALAVAGEQENPASLSGLVREERLLLEAEGALRSDDPARALVAARELAQSTITYYQCKSMQLTAHCLLRLDQLQECARFVTSTCVGTQHLHFMMPIKEVIERLDKDWLRSLQGDISLSLLYDLYCRFVDDARSAERGYAYEDFLFAHGVDRPSGLMSFSKNFDRKKLIYFLRHVCVEPVMDCSTAFQSSQDVRDERLNVCRMLVELDPDKTETYQTEIKDILRRSIIKKQMRQIEQSKIYVDIDSIRKAVDNKMRESFNRYKALLEAGEKIDEFLYIQPERDHANERDVLKLIRLILPQNEMGDVLNDMVVELRNQYVSSTEHGLDGYLSVRIRHGTLSGQLRRPLETVHLITQRDSADGTYKRNDHWPVRLAAENGGLQEIIDRRLASFSADFDELVQDIRNRWLQVKKTSTSEGLFDFSLHKVEIGFIARSITEETTYEVFLDYMFGYLNSVLDHNLAVVRERLDQDAKCRIHDLLNSLQADLKDLSDWMDTSDVSNALSKARTELQLALDRIIDWFRRSNSASSEPFGIEDVINIGTESVRTASNRFRAEVHVAAGQPALFPGRLFSSFVDIIFIVFENIVRHSGVAGAPKAYVTVTYEAKATHLLVENDIDPVVATGATKHKIQGIITAMRENKYNQSVSTEGGTGFHKIWKLLRHDLAVTPDLNFGIGANGRFFVEFRVPRQDAV